MKFKVGDRVAFTDADYDFPLDNGLGVVNSILDEKGKLYGIVVDAEGVDASPYNDWAYFEDELALAE